MPGVKYNERLRVEILPKLGSASVTAVSSTTVNISLSNGLRGIKVTAKTADMYFTLDTSSTATISTGHYLPTGTSMEFQVPSDSMYIHAIRAGSTDGSICITEYAKDIT